MHSSPTEKQRVITPVATGLSFLVGAFFSFRVFITAVGALLGTSEQAGVEISLALNFLILALVGFQAIGAADPDGVSMLRLASVRWVFLFLGFSCMSLVWSATASLPAAVVYWCAMAADVGMVVLLLRMGPMNEVSTSLMKGYVVGACAIAIIAWLLPAQSDLVWAMKNYLDTTRSDISARSLCSWHSILYGRNWGSGVWQRSFLQ
jgi:exopolysaccharide production protein ExoQ